jgi:hypothetical protein
MIEQLPTYQFAARTRLTRGHLAGVTGMVVKMAVNGGALEREGESNSASQSRSPSRLRFSEPRCGPGATIDGKYQIDA